MLSDDQKRLVLIFLGIFCLAMKMIPAVLLNELKPKRRHGFTTLTQIKKQSKHGSILAHPSLGIKEISFSKEGDGLNFLRYSRGDHD